MESAPMRRRIARMRCRIGNALPEPPSGLMCLRSAQRRVASLLHPFTTNALE